VRDLDIRARPAHKGAMRTVAFEKYEGLGNDFVVVDLPKSALSIAEVIAICDRHRGVGADGVLFVGEPEPAMRVVNADGSTAEMCGNGLRCVAFHFARRAGVTGQAMQCWPQPHSSNVSIVADIRSVACLAELLGYSSFAG
jgi:diaminopimelate epimerase